MMTGMGTASMPYLIQMFSTVGSEGIITTGGFISTFAHGAACLAIYMKTNNVKLKADSLGCSVSALLGGVCEPALFGVLAKNKRALFATMLGGALGAGLAGVGAASAYALGGFGFFASPFYYVGGLSNLLWFLGGAIVSIITTFVITLITYKEEN